MIKVDLACGEIKQDGYIGVDIANLPCVNIVHDLEQFPWPFEDGSVDEVYCSHYIEHTSCLMKFMNELYRILKMGGKAKLIAPYYNSVRCWQDPTHKRAISEMTFAYYSKNWLMRNKLMHYPIHCDFHWSYGYSLHPDWLDKPKDELNFAIRHYMNVINDIFFDLVKI